MKLEQRKRVQLDSHLNPDIYTRNDTRNISNLLSHKKDKDIEKILKARAMNIMMERQKKHSKEIDELPKEKNPYYLSELKEIKVSEVQSYGRLNRKLENHNNRKKSIDKIIKKKSLELKATEMLERNNNLFQLSINGVTHNFELNGNKCMIPITRTNTDPVTIRWYGPKFADKRLCDIFQQNINIDMSNNYEFVLNNLYVTKLLVIKN